MTLLALGLIVGLVLALTGAGGSIIAIPLLMFTLGWTLTQAGPVALLAVAASSALGAFIGLRAGIVRYRAAMLMAVAGLLIAPLGLYLAHQMPSWLLSLGFALLLTWIAVRMFRQARSELRGSRSDEGVHDGAACLIDPSTGRFRWTDRCGRALTLAGIGTGFLSGFFGVGGGFLIVPTLRRVTDLGANAIIATSMMVIMLVSTGTLITASIAGHLPWLTAWPFAAGALVGMLLGRVVAARISGPRLQQGFALLCGAIAVALVVRTLMA